MAAACLESVGCSRTKALSLHRISPPTCFPERSIRKLDQSIKFHSAAQRLQGGRVAINDLLDDSAVAKRHLVDASPNNHVLAVSVRRFPFDHDDVVAACPIDELPCPLRRMGFGEIIELADFGAHDHAICEGIVQPPVWMPESEKRIPVPRRPSRGEVVDECLFFKVGHRRSPLTTPTLDCDHREVWRISDPTRFERHCEQSEAAQTKRRLETSSLGRFALLAMTESAVVSPHL